MYDLQSALVNLLLLARSKIQAQQPYVNVMTVTKVEPDKVIRMAREEHERPDLIPLSLIANANSVFLECITTRWRNDGTMPGLRPLAEWNKGVTAKESEISCWLVSPAKRALKKFDISPFLDGKSHIRPHTQNK